MLAHAALVNVDVHVHIASLLCRAPQTVWSWRCACQIEAVLHSSLFGAFHLRPHILPAP